VGVQVSHGAVADHVRTTVAHQLQRDENDEMPASESQGAKPHTNTPSAAHTFLLHTDTP
jgi:hypothetical protein